jgi:glycosyltransferase involved in cell wall biosynthesis
VTPVYAVLPGDVADPSMPSGGNTYDRRVCAGLPAHGLPVWTVAVPGRWPRPDAPARDELDGALASIPDGSVVLADGLVACGVPEIVVPHADRLRLVVLVHLPLADETGLPPALASELDSAERATLLAAASVVATSSWAAARLAARHGLDPARVHAVLPGTDPAPRAAGTEDGSNLLCVASVTPRKGQDLLAEALGAVRDLPWRCECVGPLGRDADFVQRVRDLTGRHGIADRFTLAGPRTGQSLSDSYHAADLMVLPSHAETYGMVVTEALARGIPVLATEVDAVPDTLGRTPEGDIPGMLVPPGDVSALAGALRRWLCDAGLRARLRAAAGRRRDMLDGWDTTARLLAEVLRPR